MYVEGSVNYYNKIKFTCAVFYLWIIILFPKFLKILAETKTNEMLFILIKK